jgi:hypothetical protein
MGDATLVPGHDLLYQIAYRGPLAFPFIRNNLVEYMSLRSAMGTLEDRGDEYVYGARGSQVWTPVSSTLGPHPPLPPTYVRPRDRVQTILA